MKQFCHLPLLIAAAAVPLLGFATTVQAQVLGLDAFSPVRWGPGAVSSQFDEYAVQVSSTGLPSDRGFLNIVRNDGTWVVQNLPVGFEPGSQTVATNIDAGLISSAFSYQRSLSTAPVSLAPVYTAGVTANIGTAVNYLFNDGNGRTDKGAFISPGLPSTLALNFGQVAGLNYHFGVPDLAQGPNECGPTSAANSITWLKNTYGLTLNQTTAQIRDTLKDANHMNTSAATGTTDANFVAGKNKYVQENKLPIETHAVTGNAAGPSAANLLKEMQKGQDVELALSWGRGGGHWVTLVGVIQAGNTTGIWFNDPDDGKTQTNFSWLDGDSAGGLTIRSYGAAGGGNVIDLAIAESPTAPDASSLALMVSAMTGLLLVKLRQRRVTVTVT